ncbi:glycosyltransferase [Cytophagaceae bacterium DM2B3-1]|uniref:Glycosyltransferase n=1 Tax=Xanthocytophaga flava TaxID=3048013 RepID=A0ABT7CKN9_9BACT|nr:glycosyltransferase [Xanthocytophaga flavus]MDJ1469748.1 glycosyltransferase [Xanthocytophaga flavus]MDJ1494260.1 glycosyltransferase [Xanthocytophaga flavus]
MTTFLSVVITTYNRAGYLQKVLYSLKDQTLPQEKYEVIVIDNASTDQTKEITNQYQNQITNLLYVYEGVPSLTKARNTGWQKARGNYIFYIDDDAIAHADWLASIYTACIDQSKDILGGKVIPIWESPRPSWLHDKLLGALSIVDYSSTPQFLTKKYPFGVNMGFRKELLERTGGFNSKLGRKGTKLLSGEETALIKQLQKKGCTVYYDPAICVYHHIQEVRLHQSWFTQRYYWGGYSDALMWRILEKPTPFRWVKQLCTSIYSFLRNPSHIFYIRKETNNPEVFWFKCIVYARIGYIRGLFDFSKN